MIEDYINNIIVINKSNNEFEYIVNAYKETYNKYRDKQANLAIIEYIINGITKYITTNNNIRDNLKDHVNFSKLYDTLRVALSIDAFCILEYE